MMAMHSWLGFSFKKVRGRRSLESQVETVASKDMGCNRGVEGCVGEVEGGGGVKGSEKRHGRKLNYGIFPATL